MSTNTDSVLCHGVSRSSGAGAQTRVTPSGFRISVRVVTSKVRQRAASANVRPTLTAERAVARRKSRRFIVRESSTRLLQLWSLQIERFAAIRDDCLQPVALVNGRRERLLSDLFAVH